MTKHTIFIAITVLYVITQTVPPIYLVLPFTGIILSAIFVGVAIALFPQLLTKKSIVALLIYTLMTYFYHLMGHASFLMINDVVVPFLQMMSALLMIEYALRYDVKYKYTRSIVITMVLGNVFMALLSIPQLMVNSNLIRMSTTVADSNSVEADLYSWLMTYNTVHGLPLVFAPLVFLSRRLFGSKKNFYFVFWVSVAVLLFGVILLSNATTPFLLSLLIIALGLIFNVEVFDKKTTKRLVLAGVLAMVLFQPPVLVPIIETTQSILPANSSNYEKLEQIKSNIIYGESEGDLDARQNLYRNSTELFIESPVWGTSTPEKIGNHSWIRDKLACFGLLFIIPLALIFIYTFKSVYKHMLHTKATYVLGFSAFILLLYAKASFGIGSWLYGFAFLPLFCRYVDYIIDNKI